MIFTSLHHDLQTKEWLFVFRTAINLALPPTLNQLRLCWSNDVKQLGSMLVFAIICSPSDILTSRPGQQRSDLARQLFRQLESAACNGVSLLVLFPSIFLENLGLWVVHHNQWKSFISSHIPMINIMTEVIKNNKKDVSSCVAHLHITQHPHTRWQYTSYLTRLFAPGLSSLETVHLMWNLKADEEIWEFYKYRIVLHYYCCCKC